MSNNELKTKAAELKELKALREELDAEIAAIEDEIKAHMGDAEQVTAGAFKILWKAVTSSRFDSSAFRKANPELAAQYTKTTTTRRFSIV